MAIKTIKIFSSQKKKKQSFLKLVTLRLAKHRSIFGTGNLDQQEPKVVFMESQRIYTYFGWRSGGEVKK